MNATIEQVSRGGNVKIQVKVPKIKLKQLKPRELDEALNMLVRDIKRKTPVDTGMLRNSIRKRKTPTGGEIYIQGKRNNEVAGYLIEGTKAHFVKPKKKKALAWFTGSGMAFSSGHRVKGIKKGYWQVVTRPMINSFLKRIRNFILAK